MSALNLTIGELSQRTACSVATIRYYEKIDLMAPARRAANGHRTYGAADLQRLVFIKRCRDFGFSIGQVRGLRGMFEEDGRACVDVRDLAQSHLDQVRGKLAELRQLEQTLGAFVASCNASCSAGLAKHCVILEDLAAPLPEAGFFTATELVRK
jgi:MerR family copper efflux transcriptional regulator